MSFLSRLFGSRPAPKGPKDIDSELARLEVEAQSAAPGYVGSAYNKAGDLALRGGQRERAVGYYGLAIDAFLEDGQREAARGVANKIVRVRPAAVRTLCTLTWLDLAAQHQATALLHLRDYVEAAKEADQHTRAATQIYAMAKLSSDREFVDAVADALDGLAFSHRAREVRGWAADGSPGAIRDLEEMANACLRAAVRSSERDPALVQEDRDDDGAHPTPPRTTANPRSDVTPGDGEADEAVAASPEGLDEESADEKAPDERSVEGESADEESAFVAPVDASAAHEASVAEKGKKKKGKKSRRGGKKHR